MSQLPRIESLLVLGGGSAGLLAALTLKRKIPALRVEVVYSSKIGVIGVGEGTTPYVPAHVHQYLGFDEHEVFQEIQPVYKLGIRFEWGRATHFDYTFTQQQQSFRKKGLARNHGFYHEDPTTPLDLSSALMGKKKALPLRADGVPDVPPPGTVLAWHIENKLFVSWLEKKCRSIGVLFTDAELTATDLDEHGEISAIHLSTGERKSADLYVDCSGFASELLGVARREPFKEFGDSLFCDRAVVGGWDREDEPVLPYTTSDTMQCGWCWRIDHLERIHRGYVFSSTHLSDELAVEEYSAVSPKVRNPRIVEFRSGSYQRSWIGNTIAIGNAAGFVEPLEATALMVICLQSRWLADGLIDCEQQPSKSLVGLYNGLNQRLWEDIKCFLALHYRFNDRIDNEFWRRCHHEIPLGQVENIVEFYRENGPSAIAGGLLGSNDPFGLDGYLAILGGLKVAHVKPYSIPGKEGKIWNDLIADRKRIAEKALSMPQVVAHLNQPQTWQQIRSRG